MLVLAIETSTPRSSVALIDRQGVVASAALGVPRRHGEFVGVATQFCLAQAQRTVDDVTGVVVGLGPGLYTGLRVGMAFAQSFAQVRRLPMVGLSGLDVMGHSMRHADVPVFAVLDARRSQVFWARYDAVPGGVQRDGELQVGSAAELVGELLTCASPLVIGDPTALAASELRAVDGVDARLLREPRGPQAADLGLLASPRFEREDTVQPGELEPIYLRKADARIGWEQRGRLQGGAA